MKLNIDAHLACLGTYPERYVPGGYFNSINIDQQLEIMSEIEGLTGLFTFYPTAPLPSDPNKLIKKLDDFGLKVSNIAVDCFTDKKWKHGAFSTVEKNIRKDTIKLFKEVIDFTKEIKADSILLWPAHDGFDYPFQADYRDGWKNIVETIKEIGEYDRSVKIAVEYKSKDPRQKQYISNIGKVMMLINDIGLENVGVALDVGHSLMSQEGLAETFMILDSHNKLFQIHLNENYKDSDPDMIFGTVNFWELLEFFYYLNKTDFNSWSSIDIISGREDRKKSLQLAVKLAWKYKELADKLYKYSDEIDKNLKGYHFTDNISLITDLLF